MDKLSDCLLVHLATFLDYKEIYKYKEVNKRIYCELNKCNNFIWTNIILNLKNLDFFYCKDYKTINYPGYAITYPNTMNVSIQDMFIDLKTKLKLKNVII
tara:strand:- start:784 stop:1083 length:300 start_codon:yes stop_codon:yes gene_type:complete